jgi:3-dehydroquinate dehydratase
VLALAYEHQKRGADICKIVTWAGNMEQQIENLRIIHLLKENLSIPFLFLAGGECRIVRRMGGLFGCCMYLCTPESPAPATLSQPPLRDVKLIRDLI